MTRATCRIAAVLLLAAAASSGRAESLTAHADAGAETIVQAQDRAMFQMAQQVARASNLDANGARANLDALSVWRYLRSRPIRVDLDAAAMPGEPVAEARGTVKTVERKSSYTIEELDQYIARDAKFLTADNNADNETYVEKRLAALRKLRTQVVDALEAMATTLGEQGDEPMLTHAAHTEYADVEERGRRAQRILGDAADSALLTRFDEAMVTMREAQRRGTSARHRDVLHDALERTTRVADDEGADYVVVVTHIEQEKYRGDLEPGTKTSLTLRDTYNIVMDTAENIAKRKARWDAQYTYDWCAFRSIHKYVARGSITYPARRDGLSKAAANEAYNAAKQALIDAGYTYESRGYAGPNHGKTIPFTVPGNVREIDPCK